MRVPAALRSFVAERAHHLCEYCLIHEDDTFFGCELEHIISHKHGGTTTGDNLAYARMTCNRCKGSDISSLTLRSRQLCRLYNPRTDRWSEHVQPDGVTIRARTDIGDVTARLLQFNHADRILEREALGAVGRYPTDEAAARISVPR
jgi:hypothetical protein